MLQTYKARLHGTHIEWLGESPHDLHDGQNVHITILEDNTFSAQKPVSQGQQMAKILEQLAILNISSIDDPMAWERETRADKPLADRES